MKDTADTFQGQRCPACGHEVVANSAVKATRVRCPQCREVVILPPVEKTRTCRTQSNRGSSETDPLVPPLLHEDANAQVQDRAAATEDHLRQSFPALAHSSEVRPLSPHEISLYVTEHDRESSLQADILRRILPGAGWKVRDIIAGPLPTRCGPGLTIAAAPAVSATRLSRNFHTLSEAGFTVTLHLDPSLEANETMMMVVPIATAVATL